MRNRFFSTFLSTKTLCRQKYRVPDGTCFYDDSQRTVEFFLSRFSHKPLDPSWKNETSLTASVGLEQQTAPIVRLKAKWVSFSDPFQDLWPITADLLSLTLEASVWNMFRLTQMEDSSKDDFHIEFPITRLDLHGLFTAETMGRRRSEQNAHSQPEPDHEPRPEHVIEVIGIIVWESD